MTTRTKLTPDEHRLRIMDVAEEHFRRVGYAKTAVADLAEVLGMSSANIYRFFPTKAAINEAICQRCLEEVHALMDTVAAGDGLPSERLKKLLIEIHRFNRGRYVGDRRVHDMVEVAMEENWSSIEAHFGFIVGCFARLIGEGIAAGEFRPCDPVKTGLTVKNACTGIMHPVMIAECMRHGRDMDEFAERISSFVVDALKFSPRPAGQPELTT